MHVLKIFELGEEVERGITLYGELIKVAGYITLKFKI